MCVPCLHQLVQREEPCLQSLSVLARAGGRRGASGWMAELDALLDGEALAGSHPSTFPTARLRTLPCSDALNAFDDDDDDGDVAASAQVEQRTVGQPAAAAVRCGHVHELQPCFADALAGSWLNAAWTESV